MVSNTIILSSSYTLGTRICINLHDDIHTVTEVIEKISKKCGEDVSLSLHFLETVDGSWESVIKSNTFLQSVKKIDSVEEFIELINKDRTLSALDVTKYIISKISCTHLKLQKLLYLCYAQYLCRYKKKLFDKEEIYALPKGPVISSICDRYKGQHCIVEENIEIDDMEMISGEESLLLPSRSRIHFAEDGNNRIHSIDVTLEKYGEMSADSLVNLTHKKDTPWSVTRARNIQRGGWGEITDEAILEFHKNEAV